MDVASKANDLLTCPKCGEANPARFRLCGFCRTELTADRAADEIRRFVTVVNSDLKGSTALGERLDPESLREVLTRYFDEMQLVFEAYGGTIEKIIGDAVVAVFGMPVRRDDDALRAVSAAAQTMRVLATLNDQLESVWGVRLVTRTGVSTGEVVVGDVSASQHVLTGETMKVSSAMEQNAPPLEVLIAQPTYDLVRDFVEVEAVGPITPKGTDRATEAYRLVSVAEPAGIGADDAAALGSTPFGTRLCPNCGEDNPERHTFCGMCGAPLVLVVKAQESRKTVTLVFADPKPRTDSGEPPSPEALRDVMSRYFDEMKRALERHGGTVEKFIGDAVMAVYGLPVRHEDDAVRALRAALDMQAALPALNEDFAAKWGVRLLNAIGVNTGEVIAGDATLGQRLVTGDAVNVAARLEQAAGPAEVIIGDLTYRLAKDYAEVEAIPPLTLKGKTEPVPAYRLVAVRDRPVEPTSGVAPFVGRELEMSRLAVALAEAETTHVTRMMTIVGDAGVGKSRLIKEFAAQAGQEARVLRGRCLPYGDGITFWPLAEVVREAAAIAAEDTAEEAIGKVAALLEHEGTHTADRQAVVERVAAVIGLSPAQFPVAELFWGSRKLLEAMGHDRPLVVIIDDIHSAEQTFLELIDHLIEATEDASVLLLCSARHDLLERHPDWAEAHARELVVLRPLSDADSGRIVEELLGSAGLDPSVVARITAAAEGNPLFVEQLVSMLIDTGMLRQEDGRWVAASASQIAVPPTIHALLAARFDSLTVEEKRVLEPASVIGLSFPVAAIHELVAEAARPAVDANLAILDRKEFVKPTTIDEDEAFRFAHLLVRDTAYGSLLKRARASYHERFVDWAERINAERGRGQEFEEIHGYHLEQAYRYRVGLGVIDDVARNVGRRASVKLASAGRRAMGRGDMPAAVNLLRRATETLDEDDRERLALVPDLGLALRELGEFTEATARLDDVRRLAAEKGDEVLAARALLEGRLVQAYTSPGEDWSISTNHEVDRYLPLFEAAGDDAAMTLAWRLRATIHGWESRWADLAIDLSRAIEHARRSGDLRAESRAAVGLARAALYGPTPVDQAIKEVEDLVAAVSDDQIALATIKLQLAQLYAMQGEFNHARTLYRDARSRLEDLRAGIAASVSSVNSSYVELLAGDAAAAERELRLDQQALKGLEENYFRYTVEALLARAVLAQDRGDEAAEIIDAVRAGASADDTDAQALWRSVMARVFAATGEAAKGVPIASEAVALRRETQMPVGLMEALEDLGEVLRSAGQPAESARAFEEASTIAHSKGDVISEARLQALLAQTKVS